MKLLQFALSAVAALLAFPAIALAGNSDQIVVSGKMNIERGQVVSDAIAVDADTNVAGRVTGNLVVVSGDVAISGTVDGDVVSLSDRTVLAPGARVGGDLVYGDERPVVSARASVGGEVRKFSESDIGGKVGGAAIVFGVLLVIGFIVSSLALGLLLVWLFPRAADALMGPAHASIGPSIGWGVALLIGLPIVALLAAVTVVGIPLGGFLLLVLVPIYAIGYVTSQWLVGRSIVGPPHGRALSVLTGWAILSVASVVPFLGALVGAGATAFGLGVLAVTAWRARGPGAPEPADLPSRPQQPSAAPPPPPPPAEG